MSASRAIVFAACALLFAAQAWYGVRPALASPDGDFANYYVAARVAAGGEDLTPAYSDFLWFQQRIDAAGYTNQLGGFVPHPPATALLMWPLVGLDPMGAKRVWTYVNVGLAAACAVVLARLAGIGMAAGALALLGTGVALANDVALGQLYLPLLLSIAGGLLLVERRRSLLGGIAIGLMLPIKPFAAPLLVYFAAKRDWRTFGGALGAAALVTVASVAMLGWPLHREYFASVLPHQLSGSLQDPFHPLWQSFNSLARRMFVAEPTLNPAPVFDAPWLGGFLPALASALAWGAVVVLAWATPGERRLHYAAILLAALAVAPGGATYHLVLLALPIALLAGELSGEQRDRRVAAALLGCAVLLALPLPSFARRFDGGWTTPLAYPRLWLLAAAFVLVCAAMVRRAERAPSRRALAVVGAVAVAAGAAAGFRAIPRAYDGAEPVAVTAPELNGPDRTVAARPEMLDRRLTFVAANPLTGRYELFSRSARLGRADVEDPSGAALSPDRTRLAFVRDKDIWIRDVRTGEETRLTSYPGIDAEPCWEDENHIVFASDRGRGLAYTALYRVGALPTNYRE